MEARNDQVEGGLNVLEDLEFAGLATGTVRVASGATLLLTGTASNLGAKAIVRGTVTSAVMNGGETEIFGTVGSVMDTGTAVSTYIASGAIIGGAVQ